MDEIDSKQNQIHNTKKNEKLRTLRFMEVIVKLKRNKIKRQKVMKILKRQLPIKKIKSFQGKRKF